MSTYTQSGVTCGLNGYSVSTITDDGETIDAVFCTDRASAQREAESLGRTYPHATTSICHNGWCRAIAGPHMEQQS